MFIFDFDPNQTPSLTNHHGDQFDPAVVLPLVVTRRLATSNAKPLDETSQAGNERRTEATPFLKIVTCDEPELELPSETPTSPGFELLKSAFAQATGWELELRELNNSKKPCIEIVDMSADWPARVPTVHRGKCDQLASAISNLLHEHTTVMASARN
jgi:hypothetical protein